MQQKEKRKPKPKITITELLAYNSIGPSRKLIMKYGIPDAISEIDLQDKLTSLHDNAKDKIEIEQAFAEIHPHKDFILKYLSPPPVETQVILPESKSSAEGDAIKISDQLNILKHNNVLIASIAVVGIVGLVIYMTKK